PLIESYEYEKDYVPEILEGLQNLISMIDDYFDLMLTVKRQIEESELIFILYDNVSIYMNSEQNEFEMFDRLCFAK
ncbi:3843_t:CDS:2, partial [Cetraspora pellucida]